MHYGIDISSNNAHPIDYGAVVAYLRRLGVDQPFVIVKITQGVGYVNPFFAQDVAGFRAAGAAVAGYLMDEGNQDPAAEVAMYRRLVGNLPLTFDIELPDGNADYAAHARDLVAQDGAGLAYLNQSEMQDGFPTGAGLWLAEYNNRPSEVAYPCLIHQYSDAGNVPGIGTVDLNVWLGTEAQFQLFFLPTSHTDAVRPPLPAAVSSPYPPIGGPMPSVVVVVPLDSNGDGCLKLDGGLNDVAGVGSIAPALDSTKVITAEAEGSCPPVDGYWRHVARWQDRGGHPLVSVTGGPPNGQANVRIVTAS